MINFLQTPSAKDKSLAKKSLENLQKISLDSDSSNAKISIGKDGKLSSIDIPNSAFRMLKTILEIMSEGKAITLLPSATELTTQQAADLLNVSRPHIVKLIDSGKLPAKLVGKHRRILLEDAMQLDNHLREKRKEGLQKLAELAQEMELGY